MLVGIMFIVVGALTVVWGRSLIPRWLGNVQRRMPRDRQDYSGEVMQRREVRTFFAMLVASGVLLIVTGIVLLLWT
jgi:hypothetical protein